MIHIGFGIYHSNHMMFVGRSLTTITEDHYQGDYEGSDSFHTQ
jgi:hypothetical protein